MSLEIAQETQLRKFTFAKQRVGDLLHAGLQFYETTKDEHGVDQTRDLLTKLAEDRFNLVVVGQFKRGKSSLMNAVIGRDLLPTGFLPLTSAITSLCYGPQEKAILKRSGWVLNHEIAISDLPEYVTEKGNPGNVKGVIEARVELPSPFLRRGLFFIDTPGIGSSRAENTATTYSFLPNADAIIFVTSVDAPLSEPEEAFLRDVQSYARRLFIVVNKIDLLETHEVEEVLSYVKTGVNRILQDPALRLYPISARLSLNQKLNGEHEDQDPGGMKAFEADLDQFLANEKSSLFLVSILDHLLQIFSDSNGHIASKEGSSRETIKDLPELLSETESLRGELLQGLDGITASHPNVPASPPPDIEKKVLSSVRRQRKSARTHTCPICAALGQTVFDFFAQYQSQLMRESDVQQSFSAANGFCQVHTWLFQQISSPQGISVGYATFVEKIQVELQKASRLPFPEQISIVDQLLPDGDHCLACRLLREEEIVQRDRFLEYIATPDGQEYYRQTLGLCLAHLRVVLLAKPPRPTVEFLLAEQAGHFESLSADLHAYTLKRDAIRRGLLNSDEVNAWKRVLVQIVGERLGYFQNSLK